MAELEEPPKPNSENGSAPGKEMAPCTTAALMRSRSNPTTYMRRFAEEMDRGAMKTRRLEVRGGEVTAGA